MFFNTGPFNEFANTSKEDSRNREFFQFLVAPNISKLKKKEKKREDFCIISLISNLII